MKRHDVIVIGAGPNGLTAAATLAQTGRAVLVLEARPHVGGLAIAGEFHPGYTGTGPLHDTTRLREAVVRGLELPHRGLRMRSTRPDVLALDGNGGSLTVPGDPERASTAFAGAADGDAEAFARFRDHVAGFRSLIDGWFDRPPVDPIRLDRRSLVGLALRGLDLRRLGKRAMLEFMRLPPMTVDDWLDEWLASPLLKAALALPAVTGTFCGPRSPATAANLLLHEAGAGPGVEGGVPMLIDALTRRALRAGVELRTGAEVRGILLDRDAVRGVVLADGEERIAPVVAASCDPRRALLDLLPPGTLEFRLEERLASYRCRGTLAHVLLALKGRLRFAAQPESRVELARIAGSPLTIERAFDAIKYRRSSEHPALEVHVPTIGDPRLAPEGSDVVSVLVHYAPYDLEGGWTDDTRARLGDRVVATLEQVAPGTAASVVGRRVFAPPDIEREYGATGGNIHHGEQALDQLLVRPTPECLGYRTPIGGLFLCGSGSHPGGGLTCAPGALAARAILARG